MRVLVRATAIPYALVGCGVLASMLSPRSSAAAFSRAACARARAASRRGWPPRGTTCGTAGPSSRAWRRSSSPAASRWPSPPAWARALAASLGVLLRGARSSPRRQGPMRRGSTRLRGRRGHRAGVLPRRWQDTSRPSSSSARSSSPSRPRARSWRAVERTVRRWLACERVEFFPCADAGARGTSAAGRWPYPTRRLCHSRQVRRAHARLARRRRQARRRALHDRGRRPAGHHRQPRRARARLRAELRRARAAPAAAGRGLAGRTRSRSSRRSPRRSRTRCATPSTSSARSSGAHPDGRDARRRGDRDRLRGGRAPRAPRLRPAPPGRLPPRAAASRSRRSRGHAPRFSCAMRSARGTSRWTCPARPGCSAAIPIRSARCSSTSSRTRSTRAVRAGRVGIAWRVRPTPAPSSSCGTTAPASRAMRRSSSRPGTRPSRAARASASPSPTASCARTAGTSTRVRRDGTTRFVIADSPGGRRRRTAAARRAGGGVVKILIVDDQRSARRVLRQMLATHRGRRGARGRHRGRGPRDRGARRRPTCSCSTSASRPIRAIAAGSICSARCGASGTPTPAVMVTSLIELSEVREAMRSGAQDYVLKDELSPGDAPAHRRGLPRAARAPGRGRAPARARRATPGA